MGTNMVVKIENTVFYREKNMAKCLPCGFLIFIYFLIFKLLSLILFVLVNSCTVMK